VFDEMRIDSYKGTYSVVFDATDFKKIDPFIQNDYHFIIDEILLDLYPEELRTVGHSNKVIKIKATEENKAIEKVLPVIETLLDQGIRRNHTLVAIGGGIIQDITCFISSTLFRGLNWKFIPTTLLSQADSCIGSKSSINLGTTKNILGTFNPPNEIYISPKFLKSLDKREILSGVGEILKVHAIDGENSFEDLAKNYDDIFRHDEVLLKYTQRALQIKKAYIEEDEFDAGIRNIFNYGHSIGHAIESATKFGIPHGIAVTIGMDLANYISQSYSHIQKSKYEIMHETLRKNYLGYEKTEIPFDDFIAALKKDKKNTTDKLVLILPFGEETDIRKTNINCDDEFKSICKFYFDRILSE
jgi:3-dehydroquinate synthase